MKLSHIDEKGGARMVDVSEKAATERRAIARGFISMKPETLDAITEERVPKGNVFNTARVAGIMGAKRTAELIPMCHSLPLDTVGVTFERTDGGIEITAAAKCSAKTGVEMEALTAVSVAALTIYDMCKAIDKSMVIDGVCLVEKSGGRSGRYKRSDSDEEELRQWPK